MSAAELLTRNNSRGYECKCGTLQMTGDLLEEVNTREQSR